MDFVSQTGINQAYVIYKNVQAAKWYIAVDSDAGNRAKWGQ